MKHLIVVEGFTDKPVIEEIARKVGVEVEILVMRGNNPDKAVRLVNSKLGIEEYSKVIILKDEHRLPRKIINDFINKIKTRIQHERKYPMIVRKSIESWILACMGITNPENIDDPEEYLDHILRRQGKRYIKSPGIVRRLVKHINPQEAAQHSNTLKQFIETLKGC